MNRFNWNGGDGKDGLCGNAHDGQMSLREPVRQSGTQYPMDDGGILLVHAG